MKKYTFLSLIMVILILISPLSTMADVKIEQKEVNMTNFNVQAEVPKNFNNDIELNFINQDNGLNTYIVLRKSNNYEYKTSISIGNSKLQFVNVIKADKNYDYSCNGSVTAYPNQTANFNLKIEDYSSVFKGNHEDEMNDKYNKDEKEKEEHSNENDNKSEDEKVNNNESIMNKIGKFMKEYIVTLIIVIVLGIGYFICKIRRK